MGHLIPGGPANFLVIIAQVSLPAPYNIFRGLKLVAALWNRLTTAPQRQFNNNKRNQRMHSVESTCRELKVF
jgi:hypothetical protein